MSSQDGRQYEGPQALQSETISDGGQPGVVEDDGGRRGRTENSGRRQKTAGDDRKRQGTMEEDGGRPGAVGTGGGRRGMTKCRPSWFFARTCRANSEKDGTGRHNAVRPSPGLRRTDCPVANTAFD